MSKGHKSVMLTEVLEFLNVRSGSMIVDATLNGGGHTEGILEKYPDAKILGIEWDPDIFQEFLKKDTAKNITPVNDSYVNLKEIIQEHGFKPEGIVFDLGVSSLHYEKSGRGFSFLKNEPLDMRFNPETNDTTAADMLNTFNKEMLKDVFISYGEEQFAKEIADAIVASRKTKPLTSTTELVNLINGVVPGWYRRKKIHPATKTFQALRIAVNHELDNVANGINTAINVLNSGGRLVVISFHGLEDKIVRELFKNKAKEGIVRWVVKGTIKPKWSEVEHNPRARSAKMKVVEKI